jgi:hypothetical protein
MKIIIPGHRTVTVCSDTNTYIEIPGDGPIEVVEAAGDEAPDYAVITSAAGGYVMVNTTDYVVTRV